MSPSIDPAAEVSRRVGFLKEYLLRTGAKGLVLGISGGQDSSLAGRLCQLAVDELGAEGRPASFTAVRLPYGVQRDEDDAQLALEFIRPQSFVTFNIERAVDGFEAEYVHGAGEGLADFNKGNIKARARMVAQYALAGAEGLLVVGTDHAAEAVTGFFTKYGDGGADILPLSGLTKRQGRALLVQLGAPRSAVPQAADGRPARPPAGSDGRGQPGPALRGHRRLSGRQGRRRGCRRRAGEAVSRHRAQAARSRVTLRLLVARLSLRRDSTCSRRARSRGLITTGSITDPGSVTAGWSRTENRTNCGAGPKTGRNSGIAVPFLYSSCLGGSRARRL